MVICRSDLASEDAIVLAFMHDHIEIAELLLDMRARVPELYRRVNEKFVVGTSLPSPMS